MINERFACIAAIGALALAMVSGCGTAQIVAEPDAAPLDAGPQDSGRVAPDAPPDAGYCVSADGDGDGHRSIVCGGDDCDDADPNRYPGNTELCDADDHDEDCDPLTFGARDGDGDGANDAACCNLDATGARHCGSDCDDADARFSPGAPGTCGLCPLPSQGPELCNGLDDDCNGSVDDGAAEVCTAHGSGSCIAGRCVIASCDGGYHRCGDGCLDASSTDHCGTSCTPCSPPPHSAPLCDGIQCAFVCDSGYASTGDACDIAPPHLLAPLSTATATSRRPTLHWALAAGTDGARVEICADRACSVVLTTIDASGGSAAPTEDLPAGVVFWRVHGRIGDTTGATVSATWELVIRVRSAPVDTSWGTMPDVNGDGLADVIVAAPGVHAPGHVYVYSGTDTGIGSEPDTVLTGELPNEGLGQRLVSLGDVNGDGYPDIAVGTAQSTIRVYLGARRGCSLPRSL